MNGSDMMLVDVDGRFVGESDGARNVVNMDGVTGCRS